MNHYDDLSLRYQRANPELLRELLAQYSAGRALAFGSCSSGVPSILSEFKWYGLFVHTDETTIKYGPMEEIVGYVGPDPKFVKILGGRWVRQFTVSEIFLQFGDTKFDLIAAVDSGRDREIWWTEEVQAALPKIYVLAEDGHNEGVIRHANGRGYTCSVSDDLLVMVHD